MRSFSSSILLLLLASAGCLHATKLPGPERTETSPVALDPFDVLSAGASELDPSVRMRALGLLIRNVADEAGGRWSPRALYDPNPAVQSEAIRALMSRADEARARELLRELVAREGVDPYVRGHAGMELALLGETDALGPLRAALDAAGRPWERAPLALAVARMGDESALPVLDAALRGGEFPLEIPFFLDCGRSGLQALVPALTEAGGHVEEELVLPIAAALLLLEDPGGDRLFREALTSKDVEHRLEAVDYLAESTAPGAVALLEKARAAGPAPVRDWATLALVARGEQPIAVAMDAMAEADRELRQQGAWALSRATALEERSGRAEESLQVLRLGLYDPETSVVIETARGLGQVGQPGDCAALSGLLVDQPLGVQVEAAGAMLAIHRRTGSCG